MKNLVFLLILFIGSSLYSQKNIPDAPDYVVIANEELITMKEMNAINPNRIKRMAKGVSQKTRDSLAAKYGEKVGEREFIVLVSLAEEDDTIPNKKLENTTEKPVKDDGILLEKGDKPADFTVEMLSGKQIT